MPLSIQVVSRHTGRDTPMDILQSPDRPTILDVSTPSAAKKGIYPAMKINLDIFLLSGCLTLHCVYDLRLPNPGEVMLHPRPDEWR